MDHWLPLRRTVLLATLQIHAIGARPNVLARRRGVLNLVANVDAGVAVAAVQAVFVERGQRNVSVSLALDGLQRGRRDGRHQVAAEPVEAGLRLAGVRVLERRDLDVVVRSTAGRARIGQLGKAERTERSAAVQQIVAIVGGALSLHISHIVDIRKSLKWCV